MENWTKVYYNGLETNIEVTKCGRVRRVRVDWMQRNTLIGEIDFSKLKLDKNNYKLISIQIKELKPKPIKVHQLISAAFLNYEFNGFNKVVDHIDSNPLNNNLNNLRVVSHRENMSKEKTLKSGLPVGVHKQGKKYISQIQINKKCVYLGYYNTIEEASNAYQTKLKSLSNQ
jgi:hypothetical protein